MTYAYLKVSLHIIQYVKEGKGGDGRGYPVPATRGLLT